MAAPNGTAGARELLLTGNTLYVLADDMTAAQHDERKQWINQVWPTLETWYRFPRRPISMYGTQRVVAIKTGDRSDARQSVFDSCWPSKYWVALALPVSVSQARVRTGVASATRSGPAISKLTER